MSCTLLAALCRQVMAALVYFREFSGVPNFVTLIFEMTMKYIIAFFILTFSVTTTAAERYFTMDMHKDATLYFYGTKCLIDKYSGGHAELVLGSGQVEIACWIPDENTKDIAVFYLDGDYYRYPMSAINIHN